MRAARFVFAAISISLAFTLPAAAQACPDAPNVPAGLQQITVPAGYKVLVLVTRVRREASMVEVCTGDGGALIQRRRTGTDQNSANSNPGPKLLVRSEDWKMPANRDYIVKVYSDRLESPTVHRPWVGMSRVRASEWSTHFNWFDSGGPNDWNTNFSVCVYRDDPAVCGRYY